ncbi:hemolysin family protein [Gangjinia marincola]|uniref:Hemolysin family protein n=1 Tax=Gangjinia marincola TaxID=578463 RepID=A0ABN1MKD7_9FLAO
MDTLEITLRIFGGIVLILLNAMFVLTEFGLTRLRQYDKEELEENPALDRAWEMTNKLEIYLTGCQLGISTTSVLLGVIFEPAVTKLIEPLITMFGFSSGTVKSISIVVGLIIINLAHKIWGEQAPTYFGVEKPIKAAKFGSGFLYWWTKIMYPFIIFGDGLAKWTLKLFGVEMTRSWVEQEGQSNDSEEKNNDNTQARTTTRTAIVDFLKEKTSLSKDRVDEIVKSYDIGNTPATKIMVKLKNVISLDESIDFQENIERIAQSKHSRYPLMNQSGKQYAGNIYVPSILLNYEALNTGKKKISSLTKGKMTRDCSISISELIDAFQSEDQELCMLLENNNVVGLVTLTDAIENVFGQLKDPLD